MSIKLKFYFNKVTTVRPDHSATLMTKGPSRQAKPWRRQVEGSPRMVRSKTPRFAILAQSDRFIFKILLTSILIFSQLLSTHTQQDQTVTNTDKNLYLSPSDEEVRDTLNALIVMYRELDQQYPKNKKKIGNRIHNFLDAMFLDKPERFTSDYTFKLVRLLMVGSFFDKKIAKGLSHYLTSFYARRFGMRWDGDDSDESQEFQEEKTQSKHDIIMKYAKTGVGLTILSFLTYLFANCVYKFLDDTKGFPKLEFEAKAWPPKLKISIGDKDNSEEFMDKLLRTAEAFRGRP